MKRVPRILLRTGLAALVAACAPAWAAETGNACTAASLVNPDARPASGSGGMGGTGATAGSGGSGGSGGIGGTGAMADVVPGAGGMGGTGIVGVITGFASICVNGLEVHYDERTPVSLNGQPGTARDLAVGQVVTVHAREAGGRLQAGGIGVVDAVAGPVTRINVATRELQVMGQTVRAAGAAGADFTMLQVGAIARVSGLRADNGDVIATRIDAAAASLASVHGTVTRVEADALLVNGTRIALGGRGTRGITPGSEVFAAGDWNGAELQARRVDAQPVRNAIARNDRAVLEGYVRSKAVRDMNVGGITVRIDERAQFSGGSDRDTAVGRKVQIEMRRSGNDWPGRTRDSATRRTRRAHGRRRRAQRRRQPPRIAGFRPV